MTTVTDRAGLTAAQQKWNARQERAVEYNATEGRALRDIERELQELNSKLDTLLKHLGAT